MQNKTIIIPIDTIRSGEEKGTIDFLKEAVESLNKQTVKDFKLVYVFHKSVESKDINAIMTLKYNGYDVDHVVNTGESNYQNQVNFVVDNRVNTNYFMVLEHDQVVLPTWMKNVNDYFGYYPDVSVLMPIVVQVDQNRSFLGLSNESVFAAHNMQESGKFDFKGAKSNHSYNYNMSAAVIKTEDFKKIGKLKNNIEKFYNYEFLLRALSKNLEVRVIRKYGVKHINKLVNSIGKDVTHDELQFWRNTAKKECLFERDREINNPFLSTSVEK